MCQKEKLNKRKNCDIYIYIDMYGYVLISVLVDDMLIKQ